MNKDIDIRRDQVGPLVSYLIYYKGEYVSAIDPDITPNAYSAAEAEAELFLIDLAAGNVDERYLSLK